MPHSIPLVLCTLLSLNSTPERQNLDSHSRAIETGRGLMRQMLEKTNAPGASVAVAVRGKIVWKEGFGLADREAQTSASDKTRFGIGSITKSLTTALVARLVDKGLVDLDAPIETYLPEWPHKGKGISIRLIASHLSGLNDQFSSGLMFTNKYFTTDEALKEIMKEPLRSEPKAESFYGTGTYTVIAAVVEKVTGKPFSAAMQEHVLTPLAMKDTLPNDPRSPISDKTAFYRSNPEGKIEKAPYFDPSHKLAGAGYLSTSSDLATFAAALARPGFLKQSILDQLFKSMSTSKGEDTTFGLGWRIVKDPKGRPLYAQPGGGPGISGVVGIFAKDGVVVVILSNLTGAAVAGPAQQIADAFLSPPPKTQP